MNLTAGEHAPCNGTSLGQMAIFALSSFCGG